MSRNLIDAFAHYLAAGAVPEAANELASRMSSCGLALEARMLSTYAREGSHRAASDDGTSIHVGPVLPSNTRFGDRWLDTCELSLMLFVPFYVTPEHRDEQSDESKTRNEGMSAWFGLHPVRRFQCGAFLQTARLSPARGAFDPLRILDGDAIAPVTRLTCSEASAYLYWFGKEFSTSNQWKAAKDTFGLAPWSDPAREWLGESDNDDTQNDALSPDGEHTYDALDAPAEVTFRTAVHRQYGLTTADVISEGDPYSGRVLGRFHRPPG